MEAKKQSIYDTYAQHLLIRGLVKSTVDLYLKEAKQFLEFVDSVESINRDTVLAYLSKYDDMSASTKNLRYGSLRAFIKHLNKNITLGAYQIKIPYVKSSRKLPNILSVERFMERLDCVQHKAQASSRWLDKRNYAFVMLLYATGMRVSEALKFRMSDIENGWIRIENAKGSKDRYVPIADDAIRALEEYIKVSPFSILKATFVNYQGKAINRTTAYKIVENTMGMNPHSLRHHFATHMIIGGADISVVSELLGHSNLVTTQIYTHIQRPQLADTVNKYHPMTEEAI